jgi:alpha-tubulin suppressor-like RCC1 family protein
LLSARQSCDHAANNCSTESCSKLGHGDLNNEFLPRPIDFDHQDQDDAADAVDEDEDVIDCACGLWHAAAITESGRVYTWGYGKDGQVRHHARV